jgi:hypothetical protein
MRRLTSTIGLVAALVGAATFAAPVSAATGVTGTIVHQTQAAVWDYGTDPPVLVTAAGYAPLQAVNVLAYASKPAGGPAKVVATAQTDTDGAFTIEGLTADVCLEVVPSDQWQTGWLWTEYMSNDPAFASYVQATAPPLCTVTPEMSLGMIQLQSALASGRVVDLMTGLPISDATVRYDPVEATRSAFTATTDADGRYALSGLDFEEYAVRVTAKGYVGGYLGFDNLLYRTWGEATSSPMGDLGDIRMADR